MIKRIAPCIVATLVLLLPAAPPVHAASCKGASHAITLSAGAASPRSGTTATGITFSVHYASNAGCAPSSVTVEIAGIGTYPLDGGSSDYAGGVTFIRTMTLPVGVHAYTFSATGGTGTGEQSIILTSVNPDAVAITAPPPPPPPPPTPSPTPVPPPPAPQPTPKPAAPAAPAAPPPPSTPAPAAPAPAAPGGTPSTPAPGTAGSDTPPTSPTPGSEGAPAASPASVAPSGQPAPAEPAPSDEPADEHDSWIGAPILSGGGTSTPPEKPSLIGGEGGSPMGLLVSLTAALGMLLAAILLARRRGPREEPAAAGVAITATAEPSDPSIPTIPVSVPIPADGPVPAVRPLPPMRELIPPVNPAILEEEAEDEGDGRRAIPDEQGIPRWLRPSVREARFANDRDHRRSNWG
jgi:hypothetical protein